MAYIQMIGFIILGPVCKDPYRIEIFWNIFTGIYVLPHVYFISKGPLSLILVRCNEIYHSF